MSKKPLNKIPSQLSNEDLLKSIKGNDEEIVTGSDSIQFLTYFGLESGGYQVDANLIYRLYTQWSKNPVNKQAFSLQVNRYLFNKTMGNKSYFMINMNAFKLGEKSFQLLKKQTRSRTKSPTYQKHFENFLKQHDIKKGTEYVPFYVIYHVYEKWCHNIKRKPMGYRSMLDFCSIYFKYKRLGSSKARTFLVSNVLNHVTQQEIENLEALSKKAKRKISK